MIDGDSIELLKVMLLVTLVTFCSVTDISLRRIPNAVLAPALVVALLLNTWQSGTLGFIDAVGGLAVGLLILLPFHVSGNMGAGDVKLLGVVGCVLGTWGAVVAGAATLIAGAVLGIAYALWLMVKPIASLCVSAFERSTRSRQPTISLREARTTELPYALAIAAGTIVAMGYLGLITGVPLL